MAYRDQERDADPADDELVTVRSYFDATEAGMMAEALRVEGIQTHVLDSVAFNPTLAPADGGVTVRTKRGDADRADAILRRVERRIITAHDDDEPEGAVRCPRCELPYCSFRRYRSTEGVEGFVRALFAVFIKAEPERWHCDKCEHVWDNPADGPKAITPLDPDVPRPVFLLGRSYGLTGLFFGAIAGVFAVLAVPEVKLIGAGAVVGFVVGWLFRKNVCSEPSCRAPLHPTTTTCPSCHGVVSGRIESAAEHYARSADFRREIAALALEDEKRALLPGKKKKAKKAKSAKVDED